MTCPAPFNLAAHVLAPAARHPDKVALAVLSPARADRWSYARLEETVRRMAAGLLARGLKPGDRVLFRLGNRPVFPVAYLACIAVDLVPVPTSAALTGPEISALSDLVAPRLILAEDGIALPAPLPCPVVTDLDALATHDPADYALGDPDRLAYILFTSGTSRKPRAVAHAHRAIWARRMMHDGWYGLRDTDRLLHAGAFNWSFTLGTGLLDPWSVGATALVPSPDTAPETLPLLLKRHDATIFAAVPGLYRRLLRQALPAMPKLRHALSAGEKLSEPLRQQWRAATGTDIHEALGMTECSTFISGSPDRPAPPGTLGFAQPGRRIAILDDGGEPVAPDGIGTLAVHRDEPGLMLGYLDADGPRLPLTRDHFLTGDRVGRTADGAIVYHGRVDDVLTTGGYRIAPQEIEAAFQDVPGITEVAALSLPIASDTEIIALAYTGTPQPERTLADRAQAVLAGYKRPRRYMYLDALPQGANGKLDRRALARILKDRT